jgi:hypothetical protein
MTECFACKCGYDFELIDAERAAPVGVPIYGGRVSKTCREPAWARCPKCGKRAPNFVMPYLKAEKKDKKVTLRATLKTTTQLMTSPNSRKTAGKTVSK